MTEAVEESRARVQALAERIAEHLRHPALKGSRALRKEGRALLRRVFVIIEGVGRDEQVEEDAESPAPIQVMVHQERQLERFELELIEVTGHQPEGTRPLLGYHELVIFHFYDPLRIPIWRFSHGAISQRGRQGEAFYDVRDQRIEAVINALSGSPSDGPSAGEVVKGYRSALLPGSDDRPLLYKKLK